jgi:hypothetical protein
VSSVHLGSADRRPPAAHLWLCPVSAAGGGGCPPLAPLKLSVVVLPPHRAHGQATGKTGGAWVPSPNGRFLPVCRSAKQHSVVETSLVSGPCPRSGVAVDGAAPAALGLGFRAYTSPTKPVYFMRGPNKLVTARGARSGVDSSFRAHSATDLVSAASGRNKSHAGSPHDGGAFVNLRAREVGSGLSIENLVQARRLVQDHRRLPLPAPPLPPPPEGAFGPGAFGPGAFGPHGGDEGGHAEEPL